MESRMSELNKTKRLLPGLAMLAALISSCESGDEPAMPSEGQEICLAANVENTMLSRSAYSFTLPTADNPLKASIWCSTTSRKYQDLGLDGRGEDEGIVSLYAKANFTDGENQLLSDAVYPKSGMPVYFIGFHPMEGWVAHEDGILAAREFSGFEDVMFAPEVEGRYGLKKGEWPTIAFRHLLTWLRVGIEAESEAVSDAWGKLKSLRIKSKNVVTVEIDKQYDRLACVSFSNSDPNAEALLDFYKTGTDDKFLNADDPASWYALPCDGSMKEVAYVLCEPVVATDSDDAEEYTLVIETENRTVEVPVDLMTDKAQYAGKNSRFVGYTMCHQFILNLTFKMGNNVAVRARVADWEAGGMGIVDLDPNN
ncbi:MAG: hypothetical protein NC102_09320 [Clostridium sp.]|nr:hypothetical protein [Clostridium sp.]